MYCHSTEKNANRFWASECKQIIHMLVTNFHESAKSISVSFVKRTNVKKGKIIQILSVLQTYIFCQNACTNILNCIKDHMWMNNFIFLEQKFSTRECLKVKKFWNHSTNQEQSGVSLWIKQINDFLFDTNLNRNHSPESFTGFFMHEIPLDKFLWISPLNMFKQLKMNVKLLQ